jgi:hypothetical protein
VALSTRFVLIKKYFLQLRIAGEYPIIKKPLVSRYAVQKASALIKIHCYFYNSPEKQQLESRWKRTKNENAETN